MFGKSLNLMTLPDGRSFFRRQRGWGAEPSPLLRDPLRDPRRSPLLGHIESYQVSSSHIGSNPVTFRQSGLSRFEEFLMAGPGI